MVDVGMVQSCSMQDEIRGEETGLCMLPHVGERKTEINEVVVPEEIESSSFIRCRLLEDLKKGGAVINPNNAVQVQELFSQVYEGLSQIQLLLMRQ
ncbi:hypothetical protein Pyn_37401 [Prunus yedoensis var. nudiflora]|uniref:Uncharacterized protein n=1 Tax=Prunus yedoensis var. nudiflora TaxID=2094558 RepID=A0A314XST7_PRUYE|nr:hypothetical protein Pyn_37401 [Prunus yedoensis var. nudiflora]